MPHYKFHASRYECVTTVIEMYYFYFSSSQQKHNVVGTQKKPLNETFPLSTQNMFK